MADIWTSLGAWMLLICTAAIWSFAVYKENLLFRIIENLGLGVAIGYAVMRGLQSIQASGIAGVQAGDTAMIIFILVGLLFFLRLSPSTMAYGRLPMTVIVAAGAGATITAAFEVHIMKNVAATAALNLASTDPVTLISNWIMVIGVIGVLFYFTFLTGIWRRGGRSLEIFTTVGQYILFAAFGSMWGNMMLFRVMLGVGRVLEILKAFGLA
jgi:hypothetical protein